jgi:hypothetical protein
MNTWPGTMSASFPSISPGRGASPARTRGIRAHRVYRYGMKRLGPSFASRCPAFSSGAFSSQRTAGGTEPGRPASPRCPRGRTRARLRAGTRRGAGWLDWWNGIGLVSAGMHRVGWDLQLIQYGTEHWRATFWVTGVAHPAFERRCAQPPLDQLASVAYLAKAIRHQLANSLSGSQCGFFPNDLTDLGRIPKSRQPRSISRVLT